MIHGNSFEVLHIAAGLIGPEYLIHVRRKHSPLAYTVQQNIQKDSPQLGTEHIGNVTSGIIENGKHAEKENSILVGRQYRRQFFPLGRLFLNFFFFHFR